MITLPPAQSDVHVFTVRSDVIDADYADAPLTLGWEKFLKGNPRYRPVANDRDQLLQLIAKAGIPGKRTKVRSNDQAWPSQSDYLCECTMREGAAEIGRKIAGGSWIIETSEEAAALARVNKGLEHPLFRRQQQTFRSAFYVELATPSSTTIGNALENGADVTAFNIDIYARAERAKGKLVHHIFVPGAGQNVEPRLSKRIEIIASVRGMRARRGKAPAILSHTCDELERHLDHFLIRYGPRASSQGDEIRSLSQERRVYPVVEVAREFVQTIRNRGWRRTPGEADLQIVRNRATGSPPALVEACLLAMADQGIRPEIMTSFKY